MSEVLVCQGLLDSNGIPTHVLDANMKVIDPFVTGAGALTVQLQVPAEEESNAHEMLAWRPSAGRDGGEILEPADERLRSLGRRICWASITMVTAPYALWLAWSYFRDVKKLGRRPDNFGWTVAAVAYSTVFLVLIVAIGFRRT